MAKTHQLASEWDVKDNVLTFSQSAKGADGLPVPGSYSVQLNLADFGYDTLPNDAAQQAMSFGFATAIRNATGAADTIAEAEEIIRKRIEAFNAGEWAGERAPSSTPFTQNAVIVKAIIEAGAAQGKAATEIAADLCTRAEQAVQANRLGESFAALDDKIRNKVRKALVDDILKRVPLIAAAHAGLLAKQAADAAARKAQRAAEAKANAGEAPVGAY